MSGRRLSWSGKGEEPGYVEASLLRTEGRAAENASPFLLGNWSSGSSPTWRRVKVPEGSSAPRCIRVFADCVPSAALM
jgi:hypothetical protein